MEEPVKEFDFRAPTIEEQEDPTTPKHNSNETFDCPMFKGRSSEGGVCLKGEPRAIWIHDHQLTVSSHPADWLDDIIPTYKNLHKPIDASVASTAHYRPSVMENLEIPDANGGDTMPPLSPCFNADFAWVSVGIPKSKPSRVITKPPKSNNRRTRISHQRRTSMQHPVTSDLSMHPSLLTPPPPPMLTVSCSGTAPASTIRVLTTPCTKHADRCGWPLP